MSMSTFFACLAALAQFSACEPAVAQNAPKLAKADRLDAHAAAIVTTPARGAPDVSYGNSYGNAARWSGFYLGGSLGYGFGESRQQLNRNNNHGYDSVKPDGFTGSLTAGYNFILTNSVLAGVEGEIGVMNLSRDDKPVYDGHSWKPQFGPLWGTVRGRLGYVLGRDMLFYGTAGLAFMQTDNWTVGNNWNESSWDAKMRTGWVIGAGLEYALTDRWSAKAEYLYMDFGKHKGRTEDNDPYWYDDNASILRVGVNYRF